MAESNPTNSALWLEEFATDGTTTIEASATSSTVALYPASNALASFRSKRVRLADSTADRYLAFDFGSAKTPTAFALVDCNLSASQTVTLEGADDAAISSGVASWSLTTYAQDSMHSVLRWYPSTPDSGSIGAGKRYWRITFPASGTADAYFEVGAVALGTWTAVRVSAPNERIIDPSIEQETDGGAIYVDSLPTTTEIDLATSNLARADYYTLSRSLAAFGRRHGILDLHAHSNDSTLRPYSARYGLVRAGTSILGTLTSVAQNSLALTFLESRG